jgi:hypothetical protein
MLKGYFDSLAVRPCCILDLWKAANHQHYLGVAVTFIDEDWRMWAVTLFVKRIESSHTAFNIKEMVISELIKLNINPQCYVADNAANQVLANNYLANWSDSLSLSPNDEIRAEVTEISPIRLNPPDISVTKQVQEAFSLPTEAYGCHCHHLELIIKHALKPLDKTLESLRSFCSSLRNKSAIGQFIASQNNGIIIYLPLDVTTRWSSTFHLIDSFLDNFEALSRTANAFASKRNAQELSAINVLEDLLHPRKVTSLRLVRDALAPLAEALSLLEGDQYPTLSFVQILGWLLQSNVKELLDGEKQRQFNSSTAIEVFEILLKQLDERFVYQPLPLPDGYMPSDYYISAALDPRLKTLPFLDNNDKDLVWAHITSLVNQMTSLPSPSSETMDRNEQPERSGELLSRFDKILKQNTTSADELSSFRAHPPLKLTGDPLEWWREREATFSHLSKLARVYLSFPASSATVERTFSRGSIVMSRKRTRLDDDALEAQIVSSQNREFITHLKKRSRMQ